MANDNQNLILFGLAAVGLYLFTRNGASAGAGAPAGTGGAEPNASWGGLTDTLRSDGTSAVRGTGQAIMPSPLNPPVSVAGSGYTTFPPSNLLPAASAYKVMSASDVEKFFDGLTTRGFGDVFGGEIRHPLLDGKTPCQAIDAMNNYAASRHPDHPEWRWTTNDIPAPFSLWVC